VTSLFIASQSRPTSPARGAAAGGSHVGDDTPHFTPEERRRVRAYFSTRPELAPTPLVSRPDLATALGIGQLLVKDETARFGLNAFKLLGARFALDTLLAEGAVVAGDTLVCASEGNHGRAVAHGARAAGCQCRVYLSHTVAEPRAAAIAAEGATVVRVEGTYDEAVRRASADAQREGWTVVSDTSWEGYEHIPRLIMLGYTHMVDEMVAAMAARGGPDLIVVPGGVGGLLAAIVGAATEGWPTRPPRIVCVEPASAACLQASARAGHPTAVPGPFETRMGGLRCGEVSPLGFALAAPQVAAYVGIDDRWAEQAMRMLARPPAGETPVRAGVSGAAALGALLAIAHDPDMGEDRHAMGLTGSAIVVVIASEGVTDPDLWHDVMATA
jgi:diaminopropionate ammonia-lyase